jgi:glutamate synthase (NADPH/NADH) small chain
MIVYRRGEAEMPARQEEISHAQEEGVELLTFINPIELLGDSDGRLQAARCVRMELGQPDASGRRRPLPIVGSEFELPVQVVIVAVGAGPNPLVQSSTPDLATDASGHILAHPETLETSRPGLFAGGDVVTGSATVILAMGAGRRAANAIACYLQQG